MYVTISEDGHVNYPCPREGCRFHPSTGLSHHCHISDPGLHLLEDFPGVVMVRFPACECGMQLSAQVEGYSEQELAAAHPDHGTFGQHPALARHKEVARQLRAIGKHPKRSSETS